MSGSEAKWTFAQQFYADFNVSAYELASRLDVLKSDGVHVSPATMQAVSSDLSRLTKIISDATGSLPSYDQRQCELQLRSLEKSIEELREASTSTPKFSFKRRAAKPKPSTENTSLVASPPTKTQSTLVGSTRTLTAFSHRYLTIFDICSSNTSAEVSISDLGHCIVNLFPGDEDHTKISAIHVQRVSRSVILLPRITGSIILHDLSQCVIVVGCHQFRMHNSMAVDVYLESGSDPIIENCSGIQFAPHPSLVSEDHQGRVHLAVKDFSHILPTPSPNWSSLPEEKQEKSWPFMAVHDQALREELERMLSVQPQVLEHKAG